MPDISNPTKGIWSLQWTQEADTDQPRPRDESGYDELGMNSDDEYMTLIDPG